MKRHPYGIIIFFVALLVAALYYQNHTWAGKKKRPTQIQKKKHIQYRPTSPRHDSFGPEISTRRPCEDCQCSCTVKDVIRFEIIPKVSEVRTGDKIPFAALGQCPCGGSIDLTDQSIWKSSSESRATFSVFDEAGFLYFRKSGRVTITAANTETAEIVSSDSVTIRVMPKHPQKIRGLWVTRFSFHSPDDIRNILQEAKSSGFTVIYFQVRGAFDSLYASSIEPWSWVLTEVLGKSPDWDPLELAIQEAHRLGLELHAWINVYTLWDRDIPPEMTTPMPAYLEHPDWCMVHPTKGPMKPGDDYVWAAPGNQDVQKRILAVVTDIITRYPVDGIHLDRVRFTSPEYSYDDGSLRAFALALNRDPALTFSDWERQEVTNLIRKIFIIIKQARPEAELSAAVWGIYKNLWGWPEVGTAYNGKLQDWEMWLKEGIIDVVVPMIYWPITFPPGQVRDFSTLTKDAVSRSYKGSVYIGISISQMGQTISFDELEAEILESWSHNAHGIVIFDHSGLKDLGYYEKLKSGPFSPDYQPPKAWHRLFRFLWH